MERRDFIKTSAIATAALTAAPYIMKSKPIIGVAQMNSMDFLESDSIMIIVELFGGNDGLNTIPPVKDDNYAKLRPRIMIQEQDAIQFGSTDLYMHPALVKNVYNNGFMGLMDNGNLTIVESVGYKPYTMSHFRGADIWGSGILSLDPNVKLNEGWLGRYFAKKLTEFPLIIPEHPLAIFMGGNVPLAFRSNKGHMGIAINDPLVFANGSAGLNPKFAAKTDSSLFADEYNFVNVIAKQSEVYGKSVKDSWNSGTNIAQYSNNYLSKHFKSIARLISGGLKSKVYYTRLSSFDNHVQQMNNPMDGQHPALLQQLASAISEFMYDATAQGFADRVAGLTISEFGRRVKDNGSNGSDHGGGSMMFMFAFDDNINGGRVGESPNLANLDQSGNIEPDVDFRRIYADFLEVWFEASKEDTKDIFGEEIFPMGVLKKRTVSVERNLIRNEQNSFVSVSPNPFVANGTINFEMRNSAEVELQIYNLSGFKVLDVYKGTLDAGYHSIDFSMNENNGTYFASLIIEGKRATAKFILNK